MNAEQLDELEKLYEEARNGADHAALEPAESLVPLLRELPALLSLARDGLRYRWLRQPDALRRAAHIAVLTHNGGYVATGEQADAAIDAAMRGEK